MIPKVRRWFLRWRGAKHGLRYAPVLAWVGIGMTVAVVFVAVGSWTGMLFFNNRVEHGCSNNPFGCGTLVEALGTVVALAIAFSAFIYWRVLLIARHHRLAAHREISKVVHPDVKRRKGRKASRQEPRVVGRDGICAIIEHDLRDDHPRPQVIVGGVGDGKTAVLLRLIEVLGDRGAVPVPVRMRDAKSGMSLIDLARETFQDRVNDAVITEDEGDKIWRRLCNQRRVVVLADGLEEALEDVEDRVQIIGNVLRKAQEDGLPVVITSRPDEVLAGIDAALIRLEPLPAKEVVDYLAEAMDTVSEEDVKRLARIAELAEAPFYLRVARELSEEQVKQLVETSGDRLQLRVELLRHWTSRLVHGELVGDARIDDDEREAVIRELGPPACQALAENRLQLEFKDPKVVTAERLGLVETVSPAVRFKHSIMQAYVGARHLPRLLEHPTDADSYITKALSDPGREFLMALTMACCVRGDESAPGGDTHEFRSNCRRELCESINGGAGADPFDALAAAYEIDRLIDDDQSGPLADAAKNAWEKTTDGRDGNAAALGILGAKRRAVEAIAEAKNENAYRVIWEICMDEDNYRVRLHAAQHLGAGREEALKVLKSEIDRGPEEMLSACMPEVATQRAVRRASMLGWILPLLASTCDERNAHAICGYIENWANLDDPGLHRGVQACLAQGLKYEANRRDSGVPVAVRDRLIKVAGHLLEQSSWWYADIALLQALALWSLEDEVDYLKASSARTALGRGREQHPFVRATVALCNRAIRQHLKARRRHRTLPSRFVWIDETGVVGAIGADPAPPDATLWIPLSAGWRSLVPDARRLVADVFLYVNLTELGVTLARIPDLRVQKREQRRAQVATAKSLPPCMADGALRKRLLAKKREPCENEDENEKCCDLGLCPYPRKADSPFRGELGEAFCREQQRLLKVKHERLPVWLRDRRVPAPVQRHRAAEELTKFWESLERRAQDPSKV